MVMNSKGFRMRRDHEAKQELGINEQPDRTKKRPERPASHYTDPSQTGSGQKRSFLSRIWHWIRD